MNKISDFDLSAVTLTNDYFVNAFNKEIVYLTSFDTDKLLAGFRETAGLSMKGVERYAGWENMLIGGHTLGHYLTACAQAYISANITDEDRNAIKKILTDLIYGLKECQDAVGTGFIFGAKVLDKKNIYLQFDNVEKNETDIMSKAWVPWYTMHKIVAGLVTVASVTDHSLQEIATTALQVASFLGDWVYSRTSSWSEDLQQQILNIEYGGMNDCMYDLYLLTKKEIHKTAAHSFDQIHLFEKIYDAEEGEDILNNHHANTTIPKFIGALKRYLVCVDTDEKDAEIYFNYAKKFWEMVVHNHSYITGGNSEWEHFGKDNILDAERTNCNCETCNVYNMLKLTKSLFEITGDVKYADWYENTFLNSIMSSQNPETGMTTYFQPMAGGYFKVFGTEYTKFWCCVGTGMENFTKLGESFYFHKENTLFVNQYISSDLCWKEQGVTIKQTSNIPESETVAFEIIGSFDGNIAFRLPNWLASKASITINDKLIDYVSDNGYAFVKGTFTDKTRIIVTLPMKVTAFSLKDNSSSYAFKYGPVVLSALLGKKDMIMSSTGVDVTIPKDSVFENAYLQSGNDEIEVNTNSVEDFMNNINDFMERDVKAKKLTFHLKGTNANLMYVTHFSQYKERYGIYFHFLAKK